MPSRLPTRTSLQCRPNRPTLLWLVTRPPLNRGGRGRRQSIVHHGVRDHIDRAGRHGSACFRHVSFVSDHAWTPRLVDRLESLGHLEARSRLPLPPPTICYGLGLRVERIAEMYSKPVPPYPTDVPHQRLTIELEMNFFTLDR